MSSVLETLHWCQSFDLAAYEWYQWVQQLPETVRWPVYDIERILDASAAYDIMYHARHFPECRVCEMTRCRPSAAFRQLAAAAGVVMPHQQEYAYVALYRHCARYTTGMQSHRVLPVPVDHVEHIPLLPMSIAEGVATTFATPESVNQVMCWLRNVIVYGSHRPTTVVLKSRLRHASKRRRTGGRVMECIDQVESTQARVHELLKSIMSICPEHVPVMMCAVVPLMPARISIALYARQPSLCGG